jgi:hypothetical protein
MARLACTILDARVLQLIRRMLKAKVLAATALGDAALSLRVPSRPQ